MKLHLSETGRLSSNQVGATFPLATFRGLQATPLFDPDTRAVPIFGPGDGLNGAGRIGVVHAGGHTVELLPKTYEVDRDIDAARRLANVLIEEFVDSPSARAIGTAATDGLRIDLSERAMVRFMDEVIAVVERGMRARYQPQQGLRRYVKGQINFAAQARMHAGQRHLTPVRELAFSLDRPENRLIRSALRVVARRSSNSVRRLQAVGLANAMTEVPTSHDITGDFRSWDQTQLMSHYRAIEPWCRLVLLPSTGVTIGREHSEAWLWNTHILFERLVAKRLAARVALHGETLLKQGVGVARPYLGVGADGSNAFLLKPDLMITSRQDVLAVLDTKWKVGAEPPEPDDDPGLAREITSDVDSGSNSVPVTRPDVYQMYTYARHFGCDRSILIYPATTSFGEPGVFALSGLTLVALPYDVVSDRFLLDDPGAALDFLGPTLLEILS